MCLILLNEGYFGVSLCHAAEGLGHSIEYGVDKGRLIFVGRTQRFGVFFFLNLLVSDKQSDNHSELLSGVIQWKHRDLHSYLIVHLVPRPYILCRYLD